MVVPLGALRVKIFTFEFLPAGVSTKTRSHLKELRHGIFIHFSYLTKLFSYYLKIIVF